MKYTIVFDNGKPFEETANSFEELKAKCTKFYEENKDNGRCDIKIYDEDNMDITDSYMIEEMFSDIIGEPQ